MRDLRKAVLQALAFTMRDFATVRDFEAARAKLRDSLRAALDSDTGETTMHTPGPWTSGRAIPADDTVSRIVRAGVDHIAVVMDLEGAAQEAADNARLIAAAPDLLAALQALVGEADLGEIDHDDGTRALLAQARAAIARATGDQ